MLCISRKPGERIRIGKDVIIEVIGYQSGKVRLGIIAPREVVVNREEVHLAIVREKEANRASE